MFRMASAQAKPSVPLDLVSKIATASQEQAKGVDQISVAVEQMDRVTQQNAASAEESASASQELSAQAQQLQVMVQDLTSVVGGSSQDGGAARGLDPAAGIPLDDPEASGF